MTKEKTAMERISEIASTRRYDGLKVIPREVPGIFLHRDQEFLLKAFKVMREMVIEYSDESWHRGDPIEIDEEFEKRMKA